MRHSYSKVLVHIVWSTKHRAPYLADKYRKNIFCYVEKLIEDEKTGLLAIGGVEDHVHMLVDINMSKSISNFIANVKSRSSRFIRENFFELQHFRWQGGYSAFSIRYDDYYANIKYICNQEEHHKKMGLEEELKRLSELP